MADYLLVRSIADTADIDATLCAYTLHILCCIIYTQTLVGLLEEYFRGYQREQIELMSDAKIKLSTDLAAKTHDTMTKKNDVPFIVCVPTF